MILCGSNLFVYANVAVDTAILLQGENLLNLGRIVLSTSFT
jgi:hypothetical protein